MKVIYIDPFSNLGHINFNNIHIRSLMSLNIHLDCIFAVGYHKLLSVDVNVIHELNIKKYTGKFKGVLNRLQLIKTLYNIKKNVDLTKYDAIIIAQYEEFGVLLTNFPPSYLINHTNISGISNSRIKRLAFKYISRKHTQLVLDGLSFNFIKSLNINCVHLLRHGIADRFKCASFELSQITGIDLQKNANIIFVPSAGSCDKKFIDSIVIDTEFLGFLSQTNTYLILKMSHMVETSKNVININQRLSEKEYQYLFCRADIILLPYPKSFKYRSSGVFFEVLANDKKCIVSEAPTFKEYISIIGKDSVYNSKTDLMHKISIILNANNNVEYARERKWLKPDYSFINSTNKLI